MNKVVIIGGGFAGVSALIRLSKWRNKLDITLIDKKKEFNFLPMLPDIIGGRINSAYIENKLEDICRKFGSEFVNDTVKSVDLERKIVYCLKESIAYDYLIIASGSETNFYDNETIRNNSFKLDSVDDADKIREALNSQNFDSFLISGGGYTGIEIAGNIGRNLQSLGINKRVVIIEKAPSILGLVPDWMKEYVLNNLKKLNIDVLTNTEIEKIEKNKITISDNLSFENTMLIWAAGVRIDDFAQRLNIEKNRQGRIKVDKYLRISDNCFVVGDAALFSYKGKDLRMAIQFAISQGNCSALNIINNILNKPLKEYKPIDSGYIIPMANNRSCGVVLGYNIKGKLATFLHYVMCIYRSFSLKNKLGIFMDLIKGGVK